MGMQLHQHPNFHPKMLHLRSFYPSYVPVTLHQPSIHGRNKAFAELVERALRVSCTKKINGTRWRRIGDFVATAARASSNGNAAAAATPWEEWKPEQGSLSPSLSDILWPSAGAFAAMAILGRVDKLLAPKGLSMTIAPMGAVCAVLFATPASPAARKYNMFMAQIGCAAIGVVAFSIFGPGWLSRSTALAASIAFMICTRAPHPPAASLPLLFIDGAKLHHLNFWYSLFPGAAGCIILSLIQEIVDYLRENFKF